MAPPWFVRLIVAGAVVAVLVGIVLRFWARSDMWLDEALTFDIARLPLARSPVPSNATGPRRSTT